MIPDRLDAWIPEPAIRTHHRRAAAAARDRLWACARSVKLSDTRTLGRLVRWRIPGTAARSTFDRVLGTYPFTVLEEGERWRISGLCGRIWTLTRDYPRLGDAAGFRDWNEAGTVRVLIAHWTHSLNDGRAEIVTGTAGKVAVFRAADAVREREFVALDGLGVFVG